MGIELTFEAGILIGVAITLFVVFGIIDAVCISSKNEKKDDDDIQMEWVKTHVQKGNPKTVGAWGCKQKKE